MGLKAFFLVIAASVFFASFGSNVGLCEETEYGIKRRTLEHSIPKVLKELKTISNRVESIDALLAKKPKQLPAVSGDPYRGTTQSLELEREKLLERADQLFEGVLSQVLVIREIEQRPMYGGYRDPDEYYYHQRARNNHLQKKPIIAGIAGMVVFVTAGIFHMISRAVSPAAGLALGALLGAGTYGVHVLGGAAEQDENGINAATHLELLAKFAKGLLSSPVTSSFYGRLLQFIHEEMRLPAGAVNECEQIIDVFPVLENQGALPAAGGSSGTGPG